MIPGNFISRIVNNAKQIFDIAPSQVLLKI